MQNPSVRRLIPLSGLCRFDASKGLPDKVVLLKWGRNETTRGPVLVTELSAAKLPALQQASGFDTVALDYEHNTVPGSPEYERSQEPRPVAAFGTPFVRAGEGLGVEKLSWTPSGAENARNYVDLSAAVGLNEKGETVFLHSGALCRQGAAENIHLFSAGIGADGKFVTNLNPADAPRTPMNKLVIALFTALGLTPPKDDASDEQLNAAAQELLGKLKAASASELSTFATQLAELQKKLEGLLANAGKDAGAAMQTFAARLDALEAFNLNAQREAIVMQATYEGKVVPKEVLPGPDGKGGLDLAALKAFVAALPVTVPLAQRTTPALRTFAASTAASSAPAVVSLIREQLGIRPEDVEKFGPQKK